MMPRITPLKLFFWIVWAVVCLGGWAYLRFPADKAETFVLTKLESAFPGIECVLGPLSYRAPISFEFKHILVSRKGDGSPLLMLENVSFTPTIKGLGRQFMVSAAVHGGELQGDLRVYPKDGEFAFNSVVISGVDCGGLESLQASLDRKFSGILSVTGEYRGSWEAEARPSANGQFQIEKGTTVLRQPILTMKDLQLQRLEADFSYDGETILLTNGEMDTESFKAGFEGAVQPVSILPAWRLGLNGTMILNRDFIKSKPRVQRLVRRFQNKQGEGIPYYLKGTAGRPRFAFGSR